MEAPVIAVEVLPTSNTITSLPFPVEEVVKHRTFNCCACPVTAVNRTAAPVKYTIEQSGQIAVMEVPQDKPPLRQVNALEQLKKERGVKIKRPTPADVVTYTKNSQTLIL
jgi:hypothetical protein